MPKKQQKALYTRPSTSPHPSLALSKSATSIPSSTAFEDNRSVADCINTLRNEEARRSQLRPPPVATVHPSLRNLLDVPDTPQPRPRTGMRITSPSQIRRIPGPATPPSWQLLASRHASKLAEFEHLHVPNVVAGRVFHEPNPLPGAKWPSRRSLLHTALRAMAEQWSWHLQYDHFYLATLPLHLKEVLLTYVARYATEESLEKSRSTLRVIFPAEESVDMEKEAQATLTEDASKVTRLDLGRALGTWFPKTSFLKKELIRAHAPQSSTTSDLVVMFGNSQKRPIDPPVSWDDADTAPSETIYQGSLSASLQAPPVLRFSNLLHLSLSLSSSTLSPASVASWSSLLSVTSHLSKLQSLALGYWPCPTLTPHAAAISATIKNPVSRILPRISYGGTDMYTEAESSWREAAGILRKLSRHLYCLRWLDLTGCGAWFEALSWTDMESLSDDLSPEVRFPEVGPDWNGSWRNVGYLVLDVGWTPPNLEDNGHNSTSSKLSPRNRDLSPRSTKWLNSRLGSVSRIGRPDTSQDGLGRIKQDWDVEEERRKYFDQKELEKFKMIRARAHEVARYLKVLRKSARGNWIDIHI